MEELLTTFLCWYYYLYSQRTLNSICESRNQGKTKDANYTCCMGMAYAEPDKRDETLGLYSSAKCHCTM